MAHEDFETPYDSAKSFIDALLPTHEQWGESPRDWLFRGHRDHRWGLNPSAYRKGAFGDRPKPNTLEQQVELELEVLHQMFKLADASGLPLPNDFGDTWITLQNEQLRDPKQRAASWPPRELHPLIALAQHYGVPTRFLDWTRHPLIAAWFAATGELERARTSGGDRPPKIAVWALRRRGLRAWKSVEVAQLVEVHAPRSAIPNLHAQSGLFTTQAPVAYADLAALRAPIEESIEAAARSKGLESSAVIRKLTLPTEQVDDLIEQLDRLFIHGAVVYAGYAGAAKEVLLRLGKPARW